MEASVRKSDVDTAHLVASDTAVWGTSETSYSGFSGPEDGVNTLVSDLNISDKNLPDDDDLDMHKATSSTGQCNGSSEYNNPEDERSFVNESPTVDSGQVASEPVVNDNNVHGSLDQPGVYTTADSETPEITEQNERSSLSMDERDTVENNEQFGVERSNNGQILLPPRPRHQLEATKETGSQQLDESGADGRLDLYLELAVCGLKVPSKPNSATREGRDNETDGCSETHKSSPSGLSQSEKMTDSDQYALQKLINSKHNDNPKKHENNATVETNPSEAPTLPLFQSDLDSEGGSHSETRPACTIVIPTSSTSSENNSLPQPSATPSTSKRQMEVGKGLVINAVQKPLSSPPAKGKYVSKRQSRDLRTQVLRKSVSSQENSSQVRSVSENNKIKQEPHSSTVKEIKPVTEKNKMKQEEHANSEKEAKPQGQPISSKKTPMVVRESEAYSRRKIKVKNTPVFKFDRNSRTDEGEETQCRRNSTSKESLSNSAKSFRKLAERSDSESSLVSESSSEKNKFVSKFEAPYTKRELKQALPRKSFFSSHDRSMKDAGLEPDDPVAKRKAERLKARLERIALEFNPVPPRTPKETAVLGDLTRAKSESALNFGVPMSFEDADATDGVKPMINTLFLDSTDAGKVTWDPSSGGNVSDVQKSETTRRSRRPVSARNDYVECAPLSGYLSYVKENKNEYCQYLKTKVRVPKLDGPVLRLVRLGRAFELRHRGETRRAPCEHEEVVKAARALRPRSADPAKFCRPRDKTAALLAHDPSLASLRPSRPQSEDKRHQDKNSTTGSSSGGGGATPTSASGPKDEEPKSELEKRKFKAEEWSRSVSTHTLGRAKLQSLRQLGCEDGEVTKWWETLTDCRYLRHSYTASTVH